MSFGQNVALLAITAALTGLLVPTIKAIMDQRHFKVQKQFEADLARQASIIDAQIRVLEDLSTAMWEYVLALISVTYYKTHGDEGRAEQAFDDYEDKSPERFARMQTEFSKARRLVSSERHDELQRVYAKFLELDMNLLDLYRSGAERSQWVAFHQSTFGVQGPVSEVLGHLAAELRLAAQPENGPEGT